MKSSPRRAVLSPDVVFQELGGEAVLLDLANEQYYGLDGVGTTLWRELEKDPDVRSAVEALLSEFDVDADRLKQDILKFLEQLSNAGLLSLEYDASSSVASAAPRAGAKGVA